MSKVFYDHLISFEDLDSQLKNISQTHEEREELWRIIEEIIHHRVFGCILDNLDNEHHLDFINNFKQTPHSDKHMEFLNRRIKDDVEKILKLEMIKLQKELLEELSDL